MNLFKKRHYTIEQTDALFLDVRNEMSNFLTVEEAEVMLQRKYAIIDPPPYPHCECKEYISKLISEIDKLNYQVQYLNKELDETKNKLFKNDFDEPTI